MQTVKDLLTKFIEWIKKVYENTNIKDSIMSKIGKNLQWADIEKAKENGWQGVPLSKNIAFITTVMNAEMSSIAAFMRKASNMEFAKILYV